MSKIGRYSADRKKIEAITAAKTVEVSDCGTIFTITPGTTDYDITLPKVADAGNGWWCKFLYIASGSAQVKVIQNTGDTGDIVVARIVQSTQLSSSITDHQAEQFIKGLGGNAWTADGVKFRSGSVVAIGDQIEFVTDSNKWYMSGICSGSQSNLEAALAPYHA